MKISYDPEVDVLRILLNGSAVLDAALRVEDPQALEYATSG